MVTITINATDRRASVSINDAEPVICPLVKESSGKFSVNIKKLGYPKSFLNIGNLEDKVITVDETTFTAGRTAGTKTKKAIVVEPVGIEFLSVEDGEMYLAFIETINAGLAAKFEEEQAAKAAAKGKKEKVQLSDEEKILKRIAQLQKKLAAKQAENVDNATQSEATDEIVEE